jgi:periplasmic protein CpxP/Spy
MKLNDRSRIAGLVLFLGGTMALAQGGPAQGGPQGQGPGGAPPPAAGQMRRGGMPPQPGRPPMERAMPRWWNNPQLVEKLGINADQIKKIDDIFQQHRLKLIDLNAALQKAEVTMEPLMSADQPDEAKVVAQIDRVAQARADLEKANARMLLGIRQVLTPDQWKKLQQEQSRPGRGQGGGGRAGGQGGRAGQAGGPPRPPQQ